MSEPPDLSRKPAGVDFEDLFENAPCGYVVLSADGRISRVNETICRWTGYSKADFYGKRLHQFLNIAGRVFYETHVAPLLRMQGFFEEFAIDFVTATGERMPSLAYAAEQRAPDGSLLSTKLVVNKATDRRRYERELVEARESAAASLKTERETAELREQFIAVLGHDLRNPLAAIAGGLAVLQRSKALKGEKELRVIRMIGTTVTRMSGLIDNVLDFARGRLGGGIALNRTITTELPALLEQVIEELRAGSPHRIIKAEIAITEAIDCDLVRIGQLVSNLLGNALTHGDPEKPVLIVARAADGLFQLWVANSGEPIPEIALPKLFEPFFRGELRDSRQGLGLGLHIASQIAQAHGGKLWVSSTELETRFTFAMPLRGEHAGDGS